MSRLDTAPLLDEDTAYEAMRTFIEAYWERRGRSSDDFAVLLGNFEIDPAMREDWANAVQRALANAS